MKWSEISNIYNRGCRDLEKCNKYKIDSEYSDIFQNYFVRNHGHLDMKEVHKMVNFHDPMRSIYFNGMNQDQSMKYGDLYIDQVKEIFRYVHK